MAAMERVADHRSNLPSHIFVVGVHRSGTSLMRHLLNDCSVVQLCDETHYMGHLLPSAGMRQHFQRYAPLSDDTNVQRLVEHMYSPDFLRYSRFKDLGWQWRWIVKEFSSAEVRERLLACDRGEPAVFDIFMSLVAERFDAQVKGEKTPIHMRWTEELLSWYPHSRIIHMIRDPRAVHVSDLKRRREQKKKAPVYRILRRFGPLFELFMTAQTTAQWAESIRRAIHMGDKHPERYLVIRFEDIVQDPRRSITDLCEKLRIPFEEQMMDRTVVSEGFRSGSVGFDGKAAHRWTSHISSWAAWWYRLRFANRLEEFGYEEA
ncbi:MAG: sulfotransferase [bacterium]|nr:sulfotransferase [bacterium]